MKRRFGFLADLKSGLAAVAALLVLTSIAAPTLALAQANTVAASPANAAAPTSAPAATPAAAPAAPTPNYNASPNSGDTAWMLASVALVLLMTIPGLALFYGGMVRRKNVIATVAQSFAITCVVTVVWYACSYSIAFGTNPDPGQNKYWG
ncbi:MAG TPA: hypothetical protein VGF33_06180, partial [Caulobacteraceae bacterium]